LCIKDFRTMQKLAFAFWSGLSIIIALFLFLLTPASSSSQYKSLEIKGGDGFREVAAILEENNFIRSREAFLVYGVFSGSAHQLKPGNYLLSPGSSTPAILRSIVRGPVVDVAVTLPEGVTVKDIDAILAKNGILPAGALVSFEVAGLADGYEFLNPNSDLEGFLFPDTYRFFLGSNTEVVARKFLDAFEQKAWPILMANNQQPTTNNLMEVLTIASLLEKEAPEFRDRQLIAGILYKRLKLGIALQVDSTITYAKCEGAFVTCADPKVYRRDLEFSSLYNTYTHNQLPPGPIGNPGLESIKAALDPIASEYLYYLSDPKTKKTIFSRTLNEHNDNRAKYLGV